MKRLILSATTILFSAGVIASGASGAFFGDTESSTGNVFTAGAIDLLVDNESYATNASSTLAFNGATSWPEGNLNDGITTLHKFFDFGDLKPDDEGEDTISLHTQNDAWACMEVSLTSNNDNTCTTPENAADAENGGCTEPNANPWDGELAQNVQMFWWSDDGDNVYEIGEDSISGGVKTLYNLATTTPFKVTLADSNSSIWGSGILPANVPKYIGKAWCFGTLTPEAQDQDGLGHTGTGNGDSTNGPLVRGTGFTCNGVALGNSTQTDQATLDVSFSAVQARHNDTFTCTPPVEQLLTTITVHKNVVGSDETTAHFAPYQIDGNDVALDTPISVSAGSHTITETPDAAYNAVFSDDCAPNGVVNASAGQSYTCTITNTLGGGNLTVNKVITGPNGGGPLSGSPQSFSYQIDGGSSTAFENDGSNDNAVAAGNHSIVEPAVSSYAASYSSNVAGHANDCTNLPVSGNGSVTCTVTNTYTPLACTPTIRYADSVQMADQGRRKDGALILADRRHATSTLGAPQTTGTPTDAVITPDSFYALGFNVGTTSTRSLTLGFTNNIILDGAGADVKVYEVTGGVYPDEHVKVEVSQNGTSWFTAAADVIRDASVDIAGTGLGWAKFIRLTDINATAPFPSDADGYDVDAVEALNCAVQP